MEDKDFKSMMDEHEAGKTRGPPSGSHFAKMQNVTWGVKPNFMGKDKDWPMPANIPKAETKDEGEEHIEKADDIKETKDAESTDAGTQKPVSPLTGEGNLTKSDKGTYDKQVDAANTLSEKGFNDAEAMNMSGLGRVEAKGGHTLHADESDSTDKDGNAVGETVTSSRKSAFGEELRPFKDIMKER